MLRKKNLAIIICCFLLGALALAVGITSLQKKDRYLTTQATITRVIETYDMIRERYEHFTYAKYEVDGVEYEGDIGYYEDGFEKGKVIEIRYDPEDPTKIEATSAGFLTYLIIIGTVLICVGVFFLIRKPSEEEPPMEING